MRKIKLFKPFVSWYSVWNTVKVLRSGQLAEGPRVKEFEQEFGRQFGLKNVATVNSGTAARELAYELAGVGEGDEVITPILTCTATNLPILHRKATIVFTDIDRDLNINIEEMKDIHPVLGERMEKAGIVLVNREKFMVKYDNLVKTAALQKKSVSELLDEN